MDIRKAIAISVLGLGVADALHLLKKDEHHDDVHEETFAEQTATTGDASLPPDGVIPIVFTVCAYVPDTGAEVTDTTYSWESVVLTVWERFRRDNPSAANVEFVEPTDHKDKLGSFSLFAFKYSGITNRYRVRAGWFCDPSLRISKSDRKTVFSWVDENPPSVSLSVDEISWDRAILTVGKDFAFYQRAEQVNKPNDAGYSPGHATLEPHFAAVKELPDEIVVYLYHTFKAWRFVCVK